MADPWVQLYQRTCAKHADNDDLVLWLRVAYVAYSRARANGHAQFRPGEVCQILGKPKDHVSKAIATAVKYNHLDEQSTAACLVVPPAMISGGLGNAYAPCLLHEKVTRRAASRTVDRELAALCREAETQTVVSEIQPSCI